MWRWVIQACLALAIALAAIQFVRQAKTNPPVDPAKTIHANLQVSPPVAAIFERSCQDCHSNETRWPWYSRVAPASWIVVHDVNEGRGDLNFSEWTKYDTKRKQKLLKKMCDEMKGGQMPMAAYVLLHPEARISPEDVQAVCEWTDAQRQHLAPEPGH